MKSVDMYSVRHAEFANYVSTKKMNKKVSYFIECFTKASVDVQIRSKDSFRIYPLMQQPYQDHFYQFIFYLPLPNLISHILSNISTENKLDINNSNLDTPTLSLSSICSIYLSKCPYQGHSTAVWIQSVEYFRSIQRFESVMFIFQFLYTSYYIPCNLTRQ